MNTSAQNPPDEVVVQRPPEVPKDPPTSLLARLLPVGMLLAVAGTAVLYARTGAASARSPTLMMLPIMMVVSVLASTIYQSRGARRSGELDEGRRGYLRYLAELDLVLARMALAQRESTQRSHPNPEALWILAGGERRWERRLGSEDVGQVRIGVGPRPLGAAVVAPDLGPVEEQDPVTAGALVALLAARATVPGAPITVDLFAHGRIAVEGSPDAARDLARAMVCQLAVLHGPEVVEITATGAAADWGWLKWLPHHRFRTAPRRAARRLLIHDGNDPPPATDGTTVLTIGRWPAADELRLVVGALEHPDGLTEAQAAMCARRLAPHASTAVTPAATGWPALVGIGDPTRLDVDRVWRPGADRARLRVAIGVTEEGDRVDLDLREAARGGVGPHGLCVGATGSGKSEFLRTLALGLVTTHAPDELNLVLVDFKGGATFLGFERLRHVAAVVTNLGEEAHLVARMSDALAGEMTRRQRLLRAAGSVPDVDAYAAARARGAELEPLPTLLVIVDEFSELLSQHPEFAELFVALGRVGRSLGMHLLLASQRLDEGRLRGLETHLSYRICLKTFSALDSRAVLGTADAYDLPATPGAALLKTPSGELTRFRTAFVSGPVEATSAVSEAPALFTAGDEPPPAAPDAGRALVDVVIDGLAGRGDPAHRVWVPPLGASPTLGALLAGVPEPTRLVLPIGLVDNAFGQRRDPLVVDLRDAGGNVAVVGGPRSGKSTAAHTLVLALAATHDPAALHVYALDFGGGPGLAGLPHVGAVAGRTDRELARRIVAHVQGLVRRRAAQRDADRAETFLVVDGWAVVRQEFDGMEEAITAIAAQGLSFGVHVVVTAARWADLRPALKDQLGTRIELCLGDPADSEMDRKRARLLGARPAGHGITRSGLECVIALPRIDGAADPPVRYRGRTAPPVRLLPSLVAYDDVVARCPDRVAIGVDDESAPVVVDFGALSHLLILGDTGCGKTATLRVLCRELARVHPPDAARLVVVDPRRTLLDVVAPDRLLGYAPSVAAAQARIAAAVEVLVDRLPGDEVTVTQLRERSWWTGPDIYVVVDDYDLVASASGHPLLPLLELLPHAGDLGLHLVVARRSGGAARAMFDPVLARLRELGQLGLMMSAHPEEGVLLGTVRPGPLPAGRGTLTGRGQPDRLIQVAWTEPP
ncbi:type VII secretion protein EccC [Mycolicibacterium madagascariense]|uniref:Type VII secretion protein EccC n=1 Tax=Mycolicibacterium madagascariense TaxID=212765 RepID=A0A7I7XDU2_9MYCO|nr:type VII secretion protein EccCa [Mycolicibacterium madagascariense]MCV7013748.1 type VII secretion protein EccCa [Mycolicibacterium madagascariense]BBZ26921.1 type VII secretion protein EccC [Mycolicibacterium madagascariense]